MPACSSTFIVVGLMISERDNGAGCSRVHLKECLELVNSSSGSPRWRTYS